MNCHSFLIYTYIRLLLFGQIHKFSTYFFVDFFNFGYIWHHPSIIRTLQRFTAYWTCFVIDIPEKYRKLSKYWCIYRIWLHTYHCSIQGVQNECVQGKITSVCLSKHMEHSSMWSLWLHVNSDGLLRPLLLSELCPKAFINMEVVNCDGKGCIRGELCVDSSSSGVDCESRRCS